MIQVLFYEPIFNALILLYNYVGNLGLAILLIAFLSRLITFPLTNKQIKSAGKSQEFQKKMKSLRKKYKNNQEKLTKEMAKLQAEFLPGQLGGCLNLIFAIILLFQIRSVVINLFNQGVHAFNKVAYAESLKFPEDSINLALPEGFSEGEHTITYEVSATNGDTLEQEINFAIAGSEADVDELDQKVKELDDTLEQPEAAGNIALFIDQFEDDKVIIGVPDEITAYMRPPSNELIDYSTLEVRLDGEVVSEEAIETSQGIKLNLNFLGMDLSKVASDFELTNFSVTLPYILLAVSVGISQFFASKIQTGLTGGLTDGDEKKGDKDKSAKSKKKDKDDEPDFSELMQQSSKQMIYFFPFFTTLMSMGYLGGGSLFPSGVSLFWTGQNTFVIIQQLIMNRQKVMDKINSKKKQTNGKSGDNSKN